MTHGVVTVGRAYEGKKIKFVPVEEAEEEKHREKEEEVASMGVKV